MKGRQKSVAGERENDYVIRVLGSPLDLPATDWDALLAAQAEPTPFLRHAYLAALHTSGSAVPATGWTPAFVTLWRGGALHAACPLYRKAHSYGEYVFDWAWANAYERHGLNYYPKALVAVPFTPVTGSRLLARNADARAALLRALIGHCQSEQLSSLHLLFTDAADQQAADSLGLMRRQTVQFHWQNTDPGYADFEAFLVSLTQEKRKKIRQERRKVAEAGVSFRWAAGTAITDTDWDFFYRCYERTYLEHGNAPYLTRGFFRAQQRDMPEHWVLFVAERGGHPIASSLIAISPKNTLTSDPFPAEERPPAARGVAWGRYWGALERVDCLHFEACYYQPLQWCIAHGFARFEGGAQGEHKMARALMPVATTSLHWLAHPAFSDAVARFLAQEAQGVTGYLEHLDERSPFRPGAPRPGPAVPS